MIGVVVALAAATAFGALVQDRFPARAEGWSDRLTLVLLWAVLPPITLVLMTRAELGAEAGVGLLLAYVAIGTATAVAFVVARRTLGLDGRAAATVSVGTLIANTGWLGVPVCAALLDDDQLAPAILWDVAVSGPLGYVVAFALGAAFGDEAGQGPRERVAAFFTRNALLYATIVGLALPASAFGDPVADGARFVAVWVVPVGFFAVVGTHLRRQGVRPERPAVVGTTVALRLVLAPAIFFGLVALTVGIGDLPEAYLIQAAMPCGIMSLVVSHLFGLDVRLAAANVAWSTLLVVAVVAGISVA